jgi:hypothetical protein
MIRSAVFVVSLSSLASLGVMAAVPPPPPFALPPQASILPAKASFVAGIDFQRLMASTAYQRFKREATSASQGQKDALAEMEKRTGLNPERDIHMFIVASDSAGASLSLVLGQFERAKVDAALGATAGMSSREHAGRKIWKSDASAVGQKDYAAAVLGDGALIMGTSADVEAGLDRQTSKAPGLTGNTTMAALLARIEPGATFWLAGDQGLASAAGAIAPQSAGMMPSMKSLVMSGELDPDVRASIIAEAADDTGAKNMADTVRALIAMVAMGATQKPELSDLVSGIRISQQGPEVRLSARVSHDTLARLQVRPTPSPTPASRPAPRPPAKK